MTDPETCNHDFVPVEVTYLVGRTYTQPTTVQFCTKCGLEQ